MMYALVGVVLAFGWVGISYKTKDQNSDYYLVFAGLVLLLFMGLRGDFTTDYGNYANSFSSYSTLSFGDIARIKREPLFALLIKFTSLFSQHFQVYHFLMSALVCIPAILAIRKSSKNYVLSVFFLFALTYYIESFNITRNCIAMSFLLFGLHYIEEKKPILWILCVVLATGFHTSAIVLLPLYLLNYLPVNRKSLLLYTIFVLCVVLGYEYVLRFAQQRLGLYGNYTGNSYGMWAQEWVSISKKRLLVRTSIYIAYFSLLLRKRNLVDSGIYIAIVSLAVYMVQFRLFMVYRFDLYLFGFFITLFPNKFEQSEFPPKVRRILIIAIIGLSIIWVSFAYGGEYYPFWQNTVVKQPL